MEINDKYEIRSDSMNWILIEKTYGENKKGEPIVTEYPRYFNRIEQAMDFIITNTGKGEDRLSALVADIYMIRAEIHDACNHIPKHAV